MLSTHRSNIHLFVLDNIKQPMEVAGISAAVVKDTTVVGVTPKKKKSRAAPYKHGPRIPKEMKNVYVQIKQHPEYSTKGKEYEFGIHVAESGMSWCTKQNNKWIRQIWKWMYLNGPKP